MMLKSFVILVFAAVAFGDNSLTSSPIMTVSSALLTTTLKPSKTAVVSSTLKPSKTAVVSSTLKPSKTAVVSSTLKPSKTAVVSSTLKPSKTAAVTSTTASTTAPITSTPASNTSTPHSTISPKPTKTSTPPPTTTALPTIPPPPAGKFSLKEKNDSYCILAQFEASFSIQYYFKGNTSNTTVSGNHSEYLNKLTLDDVKISGDCGVNGTNASLVLSWPKKKPFYVLTMEFEKMLAASPSSKMTSWRVPKITFDVTLKNNSDLNISLALVNETSVLGMYNGKAGPSGHVGGNYLCTDNTPLPLQSDVKGFKLTSEFQNMRLEPFVEKKNGSDFNENDTNDCYRDHPTTVAPKKSSNNDIVPIAVGCALAGLVLIVLIAYVIGRRKSHTGYEKV